MYYHKSQSSYVNRTSLTVTAYKRLNRFSLPTGDTSSILGVARGKIGCRMPEFEGFLEVLPFPTIYSSNIPHYSTHSLHARSYFHSFIHSFIHSFTHSMTHLLIHLRKHSRTHSLTHSFTHFIVHFFHG